MKSSRPASARMVMAVRRISELGVMECKTLLETTGDPLNARILEAILLTGSSDWLYDPLEDDWELRPCFERAAQQAANELASHSLSRRMGFCHLFWHTQQRILREQYGIEWFTPAQMNPWDAID